MNWTEMLTCEVEGVYHATEGLLKLVKKDTFGWKPATGSNWMTVGQLLAHLPTACGFCMNGFLTGEWGMPEPKPGEAPKPDDMLPPADRCRRRRRWPRSSRRSQPTRPWRSSASRRRGRRAPSKKVAARGTPPAAPGC